MFENDVDLLREHIEYLKLYLTGDLDEMPSAEELENSIVEFRNNIDTVRGSLPYDEIDEDDIPIEDFSEDKLEDGELEDELVEAEAVIQELEELIIEVESSGDGEICPSVSKPMESGQNSTKPFWEKMTEWIKKTFVEKCEKEGTAVPSNHELDRIAACFICSAYTRGNSDRADEYARENYSDFNLSAEEMKKTRLLSCGIAHITFETIKTYEILGERINFDNSIRFYSEIWGNLI